MTEVTGHQIHFASAQCICYSLFLLFHLFISKFAIPDVALTIFYFEDRCILVCTAKQARFLLSYLVMPDASAIRSQQFIQR